MEIKIEKIKSFGDLMAWQEGHKLVILIFHSTKEFPQDEIHGLTSQLKRVSLSITSNIVEGFGKNSYEEKIQFYGSALKAVREIQNYILVARDLGYLKPEIFDKIAAQTTIVNKLCAELAKEGRR